MQILRSLSRLTLLDWSFTLLSGLLLANAYGLTPVWWLAWIAPVPLLFIVLRREATPDIGRIGGTIAGLITFGFSLFYLGMVMPWYLALFFWLLQSALWGLLYGMLSSLHRREARWTNVFLYPLIWVAFETIQAAVSPHGTWGSLAYSQIDMPILIQGASIAGIAGVTLLPTLFASVFTFFLLNRQGEAWPRATLRLPLFLLVFLIGACQWRLFWGLPGPMVRVGLVSADAFLGVNIKPEVHNAVLGKYIDEVRKLAEQGAWLVALPEKIDSFEQERASDAVSLLNRLTAETGAHLVFGAGVRYGQNTHNLAWVLHPGAAPQIYSKHHLVPGMEAEFTPGHELTQFTDGGAKVGIQICKDMDFPALSRAYARAGVNLIIAPAWDFQVDAWYHSRMAVLRSVESGFSLVRVGRDGVLTVNDRYGNVTAETRSKEFPPASLLAWAPIPVHEPTLYAVIGDAFGWLVVAIVVGIRFLKPKPVAG